MRQSEISTYIQDPSRTQTLVLAELMFTTIPRKRKRKHFCDETSDSFMARVWLLDSYRCDLCGGQWFKEEAVHGKGKMEETSVTQVEGNCSWKLLDGGWP